MKKSRSLLLDSLDGALYAASAVLASGAFIKNLGGIFKFAAGYLDMSESVKIESMFFDENFSPNCRVNIRGEHFFTDKKLYSNLYGMGFFSDSDNIYNNPHISSSCENLPGILDEYFTLTILVRLVYLQFNEGNGYTRGLGIEIKIVVACH